MTKATGLEIRNVGKRFGGTVALSDVSFDIAAGQVHVICGENGAGKSTLMKILAGAITDYEGKFALNGETASFRGPKDAEENGVSIIYQELSLAVELSAAANIFLGRERTRLGLVLREREMNRAAQKLFEKLGAHISPRQRAADLRVGDQQLIEIAKALSIDARVLIMDEPTSALSDHETSRLFAILKDLKSQGVIILYISHRMKEIFEIADQITVLRDGKHIRTCARNEVSADDVISLMVGRRYESSRQQGTKKVQANPESKSNPRLAIRDLNLVHRKDALKQALSDIQLEVRTGEIVGVAGLLGAGRTELLECIFGVHGSAVRGEIRVAGKAQRITSPRKAINAGIAFVSEDRKTLGIFDQLSVRENIVISALSRVIGRLFSFGWKEKRLTADWFRKLLIRAASQEISIASLSGGNQQKAILARWLLLVPKVLLLDEPTRGIDIGAKSEIHAILRELAQNGMSIVMTSSELPELLAVCHRIVVLCQGRMTAEFEAFEATEERILSAATKT